MKKVSESIFRTIRQASQERCPNTQKYQENCSLRPLAGLGSFACFLLAVCFALVFSNVLLRLVVNYLLG